MLACQHIARVSEVELVGGVHAPGHRGGPVEVVARHAVLGRASFQHREFIELVLDAFGHGGWRLECRHAGLEFLGVGAAVVLRKPQFLLDDFQLLFQEELALALADGLVYLAADLVLQPRDFDLFLQQRQHDPHAVEHIQRFQHVLQFAALGAGERGGKVRERGGILRAEAHQVVLQFLVVEGVQRHQFLDGAHHRERIGAGFIVFFQEGARVLHLHHEGRLAVDPAFDLDATQALRDELHAASVSRGVQQPHRAADGGDVLGADRVQIL